LKIARVVAKYLPDLEVIWHSSPLLRRTIRVGPVERLQTRGAIVTDVGDGKLAVRVVSNILSLSVAIQTEFMRAPTLSIDAHSGLDEWPAPKQLADLGHGAFAARENWKTPGTILWKAGHPGHVDSPYGTLSAIVGTIFDTTIQVGVEPSASHRRCIAPNQDSFLAAARATIHAAQAQCLHAPNVLGTWFFLYTLVVGKAVWSQTVEACFRAREDVLQAIVRHPLCTRDAIVNENCGPTAVVGAVAPQCLGSPSHMSGRTEIPGFTELFLICILKACADAEYTILAKLVTTPAVQQ
jgi:hypothetical protein